MNQLAGQDAISMEAAVQDALRQSQNVAYATVQQASPTAQNASGLGIQNLKCGFSAASTAAPGSVYVQVPITYTWTEVYPDVMTKTVSCSGRPVLVFLRGQFGYQNPYPLSRVVGELEARVDGSTSPFIQSVKAVDSSFGELLYAFGVASVSAGDHTFSLWARQAFNVPGGSQTFIDGSLGYYLTAIEI